MQFQKLRDFISNKFFVIPEASSSPERYKALRRNITILMLFVTIIPLALMATINYYQYKNSLQSEVINPLRILTNKTKLSFELFLEERISTLKFITSAYSYEELNDENIINDILIVLKKEFDGFIDIGLIDDKGIQISYAGPYSLEEKDYSNQPWFHKVILDGDHISNVFLGYRKFPHVAIAVQSYSDDSCCWMLRATIDTKKYNELIAAMQLEPLSDAFLVNNEGILQTRSRLFGNELEPCPIEIPVGGGETNIIEATDNEGNEIFIAYSHFVDTDYTLVVVKPSSLILKTWFTFRTEIFFIFVGSVLIIMIIVFKLTDIQVNRIRQAEEKHELAFRELEHSQKLSSIGRLAAGVAHEINNPLAIINQKAGLLQDILTSGSGSSNSERLLKVTQSIVQSVDRCSVITHRLLGFARRMDVEYEELDINEVINDVFGFLDQLALHRNIKIERKLDDSLPKISSDRGQLQQVFLNILSNAYAAVDEGGSVCVESYPKGEENICIAIKDDGKGMSKEEMSRIFEPFFTTKIGYGTGLGLPITYGIVNKLGGKISVDSEEGIGSTFTICLPLKSKSIKIENNE